MRIGIPSVSRPLCCALLVGTCPDVSLRGVPTIIKLGVIIKISTESNIFNLNFALSKELVMIFHEIVGCFCKSSTDGTNCIQSINAEPNFSAIG
jgi:hypothetical protein